jgi:hypothetical protein
LTDASKAMGFPNDAILSVEIGLVDVFEPVVGRIVLVDVRNLVVRCCRIARAREQPHPDDPRVLVVDRDPEVDRFDRAFRDAQDVREDQRRADLGLGRVTTVRKRLLDAPFARRPVVADDRTIEVVATREIDPGGGCGSNGRSMQLPVTQSNFQPWYEQRIPSGSMKPNASEALRCGQRSETQRNAPSSARKTTKSSPRMRMRFLRVSPASSAVGQTACQ